MSTAAPKQRKPFVFKRKILTPSTSDTQTATTSTSATITDLTSPSPTSPSEVDSINFFSLAQNSHSALVKEQTERHIKQQAERERKKREQEKLKKKEGDATRKKKRKSDGEDADDGDNVHFRRIRSTSLTPPPILYPERREDDDSDVAVSTSNTAKKSTGTGVKAQGGRVLRNSQTESEKYTPTRANNDDNDEDFEIIDSRPADLDPELAQKARQRIAAQQKSQPLTKPSTSAHSTTISSKAPSSTTLNSSLPEPVVELLIVSEIPFTSPLVVRRKLSQTFKPVRLAWAARQNLTKEQTDNIVLVWRSEIKIYDWQTCQSLKMQVSSSTGQVSYSSSQSHSQNGLEEGTMRPYFEAMYTVDFHKRLANIDALRRQRELAVSDDRDGDGDADVQIVESPEVTPVKKVRNITVKLKGPGFELLSVKIKPDSTVEQLIEMMREERGLGEGVEIKLAFDGEDLEEDMTLVDAEIEDDFLVDVRLS